MSEKVEAARPVPELRFDEHLYLTDECLEEIEKFVADYQPFRDYETFPVAIRGLLEEFAERCFYSTLSEGEDGTVRFATGGWSGCESFIGALLSGKMKWAEVLFLDGWQRGGLWIFKFPEEVTK